MTAPNVVQLPRTAPKAAQLEPMMVGAALRLELTRGDFELIALAGDELHVELNRKAWMISRRRAEKGLPVSASEVFAAGLKHGWFHAGDEAELQQLVARGRELDLPALKRVAADFRAIVEGQRYVAQLSQAIQRVQSSGYDASTEGAFLDATTATVRAQGAQLSVMTATQERFLAKWDERAASGRMLYVPTGIHCFDAIYGGAPESVTVVVGDGGAGKTGFADSLLETLLLANDGAKACLISPEDGTDHLLQRWMARDMGIRMRDSGGKRLSPAEEETRQQVAGKHYPLLERLLDWPHRRLTPAKLVQLCWQAANEGARAVVVDNFNKLNISGLRGDFHERVQMLSDSLQECGEKACLAIFMLVHSTEDLSAKKGSQSSTGVHGGASMPRDSRLRLDLFDKFGALRMRVAKANTLGPEGKVFEFSRHAEAGLIDFASGGEVDLTDEERRETEAKLKKSAEKTLRMRQILAATKKPDEPAKPPEPDAQATLLDVPPSERPQ
jgi:hypothetical protein